MEQQAATLITVRRTDGDNHALNLDISQTLAATRTSLTGRGFMRNEDSFLTPDQIAIDSSDEPSIKLSEAVKSGVLLVGEASSVSPIDPNDGIARYNALNDDHRRAIFKNIQIYRGLAITADGFGKTFRDVYEWKNGALPRANMPIVNSELTSSYSFSKVTRDLTVFGSQSTSVSLSSAYGSADAEYKTESRKSTSSSQVTESLVTRYIVRKVLLQVDPGNLIVDPGFVAAVGKALKGQEEVQQGYYDLLKVLDTWGYYIPQEFSLGGVIYATDDTSISDFSQAESNKEEFTGSFKATFGSIGGGAAYSQAAGSDSKTTSSTKFQNTELQLVGGQAGLEKDYPKWAVSLAPAVNWALADAPKLYPTLVLLAGDDTGRGLLGTAINLIETFSTYPSAASAQPYLDMQAYNTVVQGLVNPF